MKKAFTQVACLGEVMIELSMVDSDTARLGVAGDTYNTAVYLRRGLEDGATRVAYVTALGDDAMSDRIIDALRTEGIERTHVERRQGAMPGLYMISIDDVGERSFSYWRSAAAARTLFERPCEIGIESLSTFDLIYLSGISLAILPEAMRSTFYDWADDYRRRGGLIAFDSNYRPSLWESRTAAQASIMAMWARCDVALPSIDDEMALFGERDEEAVMARLARAGVDFGALKRGHGGPRALDGSRMELDDLTALNVVDSTAAGDSFNAGFLAAYCRGADMATCMESGHGLASEVVMHKGAIMPGTRPSPR